MPAPTDPGPDPLQSRTDASLRAASIDVGSNAIRFLAAEFTPPDRWTRLDYVRAPVRLGAEAFRSGRLAPGAVDDAVAALATFRRRMEALGIEHYRAVATSAVRDSRNGPEMVHRARNEAGIRLETITGTEEARLVWRAVRGRLDLEGREWLLVDLGGGSLEVSLVDAEGVRWSESHLLGTVRLLEELGRQSEQAPAHFRRRVEGHTAMLKITAATRGLRTTGLVATGGNIEELAELAGCPADARGVRLLPVERLREVLDRLAELTPEQRVARLGLREDRADVILPAGVVYERVAALVGAEQVVVPGVGVKDGVLEDLVDDLVAHGSHEQRLEQEILAGALAVGRRYQFDEAHARQVARLALSLFDQLSALHGLGEVDRRLLLAAAVLHDVGQFISYRRHHKHSYYLISHAELPGFTRDQIQLVALVARYHRRAEPRNGHEGYAALQRGDRERVARLAALLRIADALDREHLQHIAGVEARHRNDELLLVVEGTGDLAPERWALQSKSPMLERLLEVRLRVAEAGAAPG